VVIEGGSNPGNVDQAHDRALRDWDHTSPVRRWTTTIWTALTLNPKNGGNGHSAAGH